MATEQLDESDKPEDKPDEKKDKPVREFPELEPNEPTGIPPLEAGPVSRIR